MKRVLLAAFVVVIGALSVGVFAWSDAVSKIDAEQAEQLLGSAFEPIKQSIQDQGVLLGGGISEAKDMPDGSVHIKSSVGVTSSQDGSTFWVIFKHRLEKGLFRSQIITEATQAGQRTIRGHQGKTSIDVTDWPQLVTDIYPALANAN